LDECNIKAIESLAFLDRLKVLRLKNNNLASIEELEKVLMCMKELQTLNVLGNPLIGVKKYRDAIVVAASALTTLDGKNVTQQEREFIIALRHKKQIPKQPAKGKGKGSQVPQLKGVGLATRTSQLN